MSSREFHFGLIGFPLEHSFSPRLHQAALEACELKGEYQLFPVPPGGGRSAALASLFEGMRSGRLHGLNVTIPHKQAVIEHLDRLTPAARAIGAVNTIFRLDNLIVGDNTDAPGFLADLRRHYPDDGHHSQIALIMGAGGSARAVAYALVQAGWGIVIAARRLAQAQEVVAALRSPVVQATGEPGQCLLAVPFDPTAIAGRLLRLQNEQQAKIVLVNTTPLGMLPRIGESPWPEEVPLPEAAFVYDLVYNPPETLLVARARRAGLLAANGAGMLVEQAALAFERWTGLEAPRAAMWHVMTDGG